MGNLFTALIREIKFFLYREEMLESGLLPANYANSSLPQAESLQRSTLHVPYIRSSNSSSSFASSEQGTNNNSNVALACPTGVKMTRKLKGICGLEMGIPFQLWRSIIQVPLYVEPSEISTFASSSFLLLGSRLDLESVAC